MRDREHGPGAVRGTPHRTAPPGTRDDTADIRQDIEQTRAEMSGTIDVIQHRLDPETLSEQAKDTASDITTQAKEAAREVVDHALAEAREAVQDATVHVKTAVREATIGKVETMVRTANDMTNEARYSMMDTIKQNPFPAVLAGIGIGWLYINSRSAAARGNGSREYRSTIYGQPSRYSDYPPYPSRWSGQDRNPVGQAMDRVQETTGSLADRAGSAMDQVGETAGNVSGQVRQTAGNFASQVGDTAGSVASQVGDTAGNFANQVGGTASDLAGQAQYQVYRLEDRFQQTLHSNPLAVGAAALVLGAAVGLALPSTRKEDELMGEARDTALDRVQSAAQETMEKAGQVAEKVQTTAKEESQRQGLTQ
jgi:vacuolar-type H+-ATPase subunit H